MDFLPNCTTSVHSIDGFDTIYCWRYIPAKDNWQETPLHTTNISPSDLRNRIANVRKTGCLIAYDSQHECLWLFGQSDVNLYQTLNTFLKPQESQDTALVVSGTTLNAQSFSLTAAQILNSAFGSVLQSRENTSNIDRLDESLLTDAYRYFVEACVQLLRIHLFSTAQILPVNFRTFTGNMNKAGQLFTSFDAENLQQAIDISVELNANGYLLLSLKRSIKPNWQTLHPGFTALGHIETQHAPCLVRIVPNGRIMRVVSPVNALPSPSSISESSNSVHEALITSGPSAPDENILLWRRMVIERLCLMGLKRDTVDNHIAWVRLSPTPRRSDPKHTKRQHVEDVTFDWPVSLCIAFNSQTPFRGTQGSTTENGLQWFQTKMNNGFQDPLELALKFFQDQHMREDEIRSRQLKDGRGNSRPSPPYQRNIVGVDSQGLSGIYPTPPDGLPSGITPASVTADGLVAPKTTNCGAGDSELSTNTNIVAVSRDSHDGTARRLCTFSDVDDQDAVFGDAEEEEEDELFNSRGITEDDFNFFDEPNCGVDEDMHDVSALEESDFMLDANQPTSVAISRDWPSGGDFPASGHDLEILDADVRTDEEHRGDVAPDKHDNARLMSVSEHSPLSNSLNAKPASPPLDPMSVRNRFNSKSPMAPPPKPMACAAAAGIVDNPWRPLHFRNAVGNSDSKYYSSGRFLVKEVDVKPASAIERAHGLQLAPLSTTSITSPSDPRSYSRAGAPGSLKPHQSFADHFGITVADVVEADSDSETDSSDSEWSADRSSLWPRHNAKRRKLITLPPPSCRNSTDSRLRSTINTPNFDSIKTNTANLAENWLGSLLDALVVEDLHDWSLTDYPTPRFNNPKSWSLTIANETEFIAIAQTVAMQLLIGTEHLTSNSDRVLHRADIPLQFRAPSVCINSAIVEAFAGFGYNLPQNLVANVLLRGEVTTESISLKVSNRTEIISDETSSEVPEHLFIILAPRIQVQRIDSQKAGSAWELLPSAFQFWETLGLAPASSPKTVEAYCIYPYSDATEPCVQHFFDLMGSTWDSCKLGHHRLGSSAGGNIDSLLALHLSEEISKTAAILVFEQACQQLGTELSQWIQPDDVTTVIYMINPFSEDDSLYNLSICFARLVYRMIMASHFEAPIQRLPILQIIPITMIASFEAPLHASTGTLATFARTVYDRCPATTYSQRPDLRIFSPASVVLADATAKNFHFKLTSEPPSDVLHERSYIHVSYCQSLDDNWIVAAWTDDTGQYQHMATYSLLGLTIFKEVAQEIWDSTLVYTGDRKTKWIVCITKAGPLEPLERDMWCNIISTTATASIDVDTILLSVITNPIIEVYPAAPPVRSFTPAGQAPNNTTTPISTPQAQVFSPLPATPGGVTALQTPGPPAEAPDADPNARLTDIVDESWGIILERSLSVSRSIVAYNPSLASGYLAKRTGAGETDPLVLVEVNIMGMLFSAAGRQYVDLGTLQDRRRKARKQLKEVLIAYRGLALLARLKGLESETGTRPWHVLVVEKVVQGLMKCVPVPDGFPTGQAN